MQYNAVDESDIADVLVIPKSNTDLKVCREEFFRVLSSPRLFAKPNKR